MNLLNKLTIIRIALVPFFMAAILINFPFHYLVALAIFGVASLTDMFDGKIARSRNLVTNFGKFSDPLADKILVLSTLLCFVQNGLCDAVIVVVVLFRVKTVTQIIAIIIIFVLQFSIELMNLGIIPINVYDIALISRAFFVIGEVVLWISTIFCIISGVIYLIDNREFISME